ncbi:hypothetical protein SESBI_42552 [Sesbania bispinosa]|nr:hypothetical protein SESBI_42552 [Sesbania bispinosa]
MKGGSSCTVEKKMPRCNSSLSSSLPRGRRCRCGEKLLMFTSNSTKNPGKHFRRCPFWDVSIERGYC